MKFFNLQGLSRRTISYLFLLKIGFGILLWAIYTYYYTDRTMSDIFKFYDDAKYIYQALPKHPLHYLQMVMGINTDADYLKPYYSEMHNWHVTWDSANVYDNKIIIQFNALVYLFSFGHYNVHTVFICFLSLMGLTGIYKTFSSVAPDKFKELAIAVFLIPSVLFWASGVLKEGLIIFALGILIYTLYKSLYGNAHFIGYFIFFLLSAALLLLTKLYVFVAIAPVIISLIVVRLTANKFVFLKFTGIHLLLFIIAANIYRLHLGVDVMRFLHRKQMSSIQFAITEKARSYFAISHLKPSVISLIENTPEAIINTLCRPFLFESKSLFILISSVENILLLVLVVTSIVFFKKPNKEALALLYSSIFFVFVLALLIGLVTPVLGSIVRYRVPIMPFYAIIFLLIIDKEKLIKKLSALTFS